MTWATWAALLLYLLLCLGPARRVFLGQWRFTIPASAAGWATVFLTRNMPVAREAWWAPLALGFCVGLGAGAAGKQWLDEVLGGGR